MNIVFIIHRDDFLRYLPSVLILMKLYKNKNDFVGLSDNRLIKHSPTHKKKFVYHFMYFEVELLRSIASMAVINKISILLNYGLKHSFFIKPFLLPSFWLLKRVLETWVFESRFFLNIQIIIHASFFELKQWRFIIERS